MVRVIIAMAAIACLCGQAAQADDRDLTDLSLEELLTIEVTSVAKKRQRVEDSAAAVFVISSEDIRRSGATRITDLFRMVPGMQVGENDSNSVAVSARGFNERFASKLLILVDGRAIYRSVLSGVFWDQVLVPLQEIERIEVVRGPGATLWGANAVNGVINIITKHPIDTQDGTVVLRAGSNEIASAYGRWGGLVGDDGAYRFHARGDIRRGLVDAEGDQISDASRTSQVGFRMDWEPTPRDAFTIQGDIHRGEIETVTDGAQLNIGSFPALTKRDDFFGFNVLGRWAHSGEEFGDLSIQTFVDFLVRGEFGSSINSSIFGFDFQHTLPAMGAHEIVWGTNIQFTHDRASGVFINFDPVAALNQTYGLFVQDEIDLIEQELSLTLGTKLEYNTYSGFEVQPSARLFWRPDDGFALWGAVSRAVRTPARFEQDLSIFLQPIPPGVPPNTGPLPLTFGIVGNNNLNSEELLSFELGGRFDLSQDISVDVATYFNIYENLISISANPPVLSATGIQQTLGHVNQGSARSFGVEVSADWRVLDWWTLIGSYSHQNIRFNSGGATGEVTHRTKGLTPQHQGSIRSQFDLSESVEFDLWLRAQTGLSSDLVTGFADLDARLSWRPRPDLILTLSGRNLLQSRRVDFKQVQYPAPTGQLERSVLGTVEFRF